MPLLQVDALFGLGRHLYSFVVAAGIRRLAHVGAGVRVFDKLVVALRAALQSGVAVSIYLENILLGLRVVLAYARCGPYHFVNSDTAVLGLVVLLRIKIFKTVGPTASQRWLGIADRRMRHLQA